MNRTAMFFAFAAMAAIASALAQIQPPELTLQAAQDLAIENHPQVLAAQSAVGVANAQVTETRSAYYPDLSAEITGSQGNVDSRIGAGALTASRLFNRFGQGIVFSQLVTDTGRTPNLVASSRFQAQASGKDYEATRADVLLQVDRAYFDLLHARAVVKVAERTVAARQLLLDQVSALAK
ncbi:MAG: TolC family protein, partial [Bryobacteraceae bacterium]